MNVVMTYRIPVCHQDIHHGMIMTYPVAHFRSCRVTVLVKMNVAVVKFRTDKISNVWVMVGECANSVHIIIIIAQIAMIIVRMRR